MGAAATTAKQPLAEVDVKNEIGVLYGEEAQQAFAAAKEDDVVAWPKVQAYAEAHGLLNQKKSILFKNLRQFKIARDQIEAVYDEHFTGAVCEIAWHGKGLGDDRRQCALHGAPAETLDELYEVGKKALLKYGEVMTAACPSGAVLKLAPLNVATRRRAARQPTSAARGCVRRNARTASTSSSGARHVSPKNLARLRSQASGFDRTVFSAFREHRSRRKNARPPTASTSRCAQAPTASADSKAAPAGAGVSRASRRPGARTPGSATKSAPAPAASRASGRPVRFALPST